jgi:hypothetical protein
MEKKHPGADGDDFRLCGDKPRPPKRIKREQFEAKDIVGSLRPEQLNRPLVEQGLIYSERLDEGSVRILVLNPGSGTDDIECNLMQKEDLAQASLGKMSPYEAVSYAWGDEKNSDFITLCGSRFAVTRNLAEALRYLRYPKSDRMLWVDAICINQCDQKEKEAHVLSMHQVYKLAEKVIAWLGPPDDASILAYGTMKLMQEQDIVPVSAAVTFQISKEGTINKVDAFLGLMSRSYWSRAWIVQEIISAQVLVLQCGSDVVPYSKLEEVYPHNTAAHIRVSSDESESAPIGFQGDSEVVILRRGSEKICGNKFLDCFLDRQCRERHDNIFAFLNLLSDDIQRKIRVCYKTDIRKLVRVTAQAIIESTQSLHIIVIRGRQKPPIDRESEKWQLSMPTWCPYLATPYQCCSIGPQTKPSLFAEKAVFSFVNNRMRVRGFVIGRVSQIISRRVPCKIRETVWSGEADIERERKHYMKCLCLGLNGVPLDKHKVQTSTEATTRTLLVGRGNGICDAQTLLGSEPGNDGEIAALRKIWNNGRFRLVCSFRLGKAAARALYSIEAAPAAWVNRVALVPHTVRQGDAICTILGCTTPVVLRRVGKHYHVMGEAYVDTSAMGKFRVAVELRDFVLK